MKVVGLEKLKIFHLGHFNWINSGGSATENKKTLEDALRGLISLLSFLVLPP